MTQKKFGVWGALLLSCSVLVGCDLKLARDLLESGMDAAMNDCQNTPQGKGLPRGDCGESELGDGLVCPDRTDSSGTPVECKYEHEFNVQGSYPGYGGAGRKVKISISTRTQDYRLASHSHQCETEEEGECAESFVSAKATVYQDSEVQIAWSFLGVLHWETVVRQSRSFDFCSREDHPEPRACGPIENSS